MQNNDDHHRLESHGISRNTRSSKWLHIQQPLSPEPNTQAILGVAK
jgi:hypothetical protein